MNLHVALAVLINASYAPVIVFLLQKNTFSILVFTNQLVAFLTALFISTIFYKNDLQNLLKQINLGIFYRITIAALLYIAFNLSFLYALQNSNPAQVNLIGEAWPAFMFIGLILIRRSKANINPAKIISFTIATLGAIVIASGNVGFSIFDIDFPLLIALSAAIWGGLNNVFVIWAADLVKEKGISNDRVSTAICLEMIVRGVVTLGMIAIIIAMDYNIDLNLDFSEISAILYCGIFVAAIQNILWTIGMDSKNELSDSILAFVSPLLSFLALASFYDVEISLISVLGGVMVIFANIIINFDYKYFNSLRLLGVPFLFLLSLFCLYTPTLEIARPENITSLSLVFSIVVGFTLSILSAQAREIRKMFSEFIFTQQGISSETQKEIETAANSALGFAQIGAKINSLPENERKIVKGRFLEITHHMSSIRYYNIGLVSVLITAVFVMTELLLREGGLFGDVVTISTCTIAVMIALYIIDLNNLELNYRILMSSNDVVDKSILKLNIIQLVVALISCTVIVNLLLEKYGS